MSPGKKIKQAALEIVNDIQARALSKKKELADIEIRKTQIESDLNSVNLCLDRLASFQPYIGRDLQCPWCWGMHETKSCMRPAPSKTSDDKFNCRECGLEIEIPA